MYRSRLFSNASQTYSNPTITGTVTFGDGTAATQVISSNLSGGTDPTLTFGNNAITVGSGVLISPLGLYLGASNDAAALRFAANGIVYGNAAVANGAATTRAELNKAVSAIANAVATDVLTVTIPNAAHSATLLVRVIGSLGAGGAIGANEATATNSYVIAITRTPGVATTAVASSAFGAAATAVAGAATVTATAAVTAMSGAVGAQQTFTVQVTISRSGGSSTNHTCLVYAELMNANVTGITIA